MNDLKINIIVNPIITFILSSCIWSTIIYAQTPEVMLLIDASGSMQMQLENDRYPEGCEVSQRFPNANINLNGEDQGELGEPGENRENANQNIAAQSFTRMHYIQEMLAGRITGSKGCLAHPAEERHKNYITNRQASQNGHIMGGDGNRPHYRLMCTTQGSAVPDVPCGADHGRKRDVADPDNPRRLIPANISNNGIIERESSAVRFGLMISDSNPVKAIGQQTRNQKKDWSYGDEKLSIYLPRTWGMQDEDLANQVQAMNIIFPSPNGDNEFKSARTSVAFNPQIWGGEYQARYHEQHSYYLEDYLNEKINLGVQSTDSHAGRLIYPFKGIMTNPSQEINQDANDIILHNQWVKDEIRRIIPLGPSPLSAMLADLKGYYHQNPSAVCQQRVNILITDGSESTYLPTQSCRTDQDCSSVYVSGQCIDVNQSTRVNNEMWDTQDLECGQNCVKSCVYQNGAPYKSAIILARELWEEYGIATIVATVGLPDTEDYDDELADMPPSLAYAYQIAMAGSSNLGPRSGVPGIYRLEDLPFMSTILRKIKQLDSQVVQTEVQPLVLSPAEGDALLGQSPDKKLRQWRISSFAFSGQQDNRLYGSIESNDLGCEGHTVNQRGLTYLDNKYFSNVLSEQNKRPVFTVDPDTHEVVNVADLPTSIFYTSGWPNGDLYKKFLPGRLLRDVIKFGKQIRGYFGKRGLSKRGFKVRSFGANFQGDLAVLTPPVKGSNTSGAPIFFETNKKRPHMIIMGSSDGMVHVFRAFDGHNLFSFIPKSSWEAWGTRKEWEFSVGGPIVAKDILPCRSITGANINNCPSAQNVIPRTMIVGAVGKGSRNIYGFELKYSVDNLRDSEPNINAWPNNAVLWNLTSREERDLGLAVSRPILINVRMNQVVKAVALVGCGDDPRTGWDQQSRPGDVGRCLLMIDPLTGEVIRKIDRIGGTAFNYPVVGSPTAYPNDDTPAESVYVGDKAGQLWRLDLNGDGPNNWKLDRIWPLNDPQGNQVQFQKGIGHGIYERPSLSRATNQDLVVVFATSNQYSPNLSGVVLSQNGYMVSLREKTIYQQDGREEFKVEANWVLDFGDGEFATGATKIKDQVVYVTTSRPKEQEICDRDAQLEGRLYGVHYTNVSNRRYLDRDGDRSLQVLPMLPRYNQQGQKESNALSLILPAGRTAHGFALVPTPSCSLEVGSITELVLNLSDDPNKGSLFLNGLAIEFVDQNIEAGEGNQNDMPGGGAIYLEKSDLNQALKVKLTGKTFQVSLAPPDGVGSSAGFNPISPFPSKILYWGSGYSQ
jgi:hypothetical protein